MGFIKNDSKYFIKLVNNNMILNIVFTFISILYITFYKDNVDILSNKILPIFILVYIILVSILFSYIKKKKISELKHISIITSLLLFLTLNITNINNVLLLLTLLIPVFISSFFNSVKITKIYSYVTGILLVLLSILHVVISLNNIYNVLLILFISFVFIRFINQIVKNNSFILNSYNALYNEREFFRIKSSVDQLTGLYNHATYKEKLKSSLGSENKIFLSVIDIDFFKKVNDTYGHSAGDVVLKYLSRLLSHLNGEDIFTARYGGEEFVILFLNHNEEEVVSIVEKLKKNFKAKAFKELDGNSCSFSSGISKEKTRDNVISIFDRADEALYEAKKTGRDKIIVYKK